MLAFEIEYLLGRAFAGDFRDRSVSEWPPHPVRFFSALAATHFETGPTCGERAALEWLEQQGPPQIRAGEAGKPASVVAYVPTNYPGAQVPALRNKQPREFPAQSPSDPIVHFIWPGAEPSVEILRDLDSLAERTGYLGKACSFVRMRVVNMPPEPNYLPVEAGGDALRIAGRGRLAELEMFFGAGMRPSFGLQQRYAPSENREMTELGKSFFGEMIVFRKIGGPGFPIESALTLTDAARLALLSQAGRIGEIPEILHGHVENGHCAFIALPFAGARHADGHLVGLGLVLPASIRDKDRNAILRACRTLEEIHLPSPLKSWQVKMINEKPLASTLRQESWTGPARCWSTVTPVILDRFPKKKGPTIEDILRTACRRAGLPEPAIVEHTPFSHLTGVPPVPAFRLVRRKNDRARWGVHVILQFDQNILGPVLVGAGRFFGLGLFKPQDAQFGEMHDQ